MCSLQQYGPMISPMPAYTAAPSASMQWLPQALAPATSQRMDLAVPEELCGGRTLGDAKAHMHRQFPGPFAPGHDALTQAARLAQRCRPRRVD